jgi:RNA polymerase sigma factor (sigma-70 family)
MRLWRQRVANHRTSTGFAGLLQSIRALGGADLSDGLLLRRFLVQRDEDAFAALVRRHGAMVLGVCRRLLGNSADADDAFQATFLVLVRKAAALSGRAVLGDWLHGVARNIALNAKRMAARRRVKEQAIARSEVQLEPARDDWLPLLDEELGGLREKYRLPIVLCDLEGKSRREAAASLGWPEGTVAGRLARGRALLAKRLARRAPMLSMATVSATLAQHAASAAVPVTLAESTVKAACFVAAGSTTASAAVSAKVIALVEGAVKTMLLNKLKTIATAGIVVLAAAAVAYGAFAQERLAGNQEAARQAAVKPNVTPGDQKAEQDPVKDNAKPTRLAIMLDKKSYEVGEPIKLTVSLSNVSDTPFDVPATSDSRGQYDTTFSFVVKNDKGAVLQHPGRGKFAAMSVLGGQQALPPGKFYTREFLLNYQISPLTPGEYRVHAVFQPGSAAGPRDVRAQSPEVTIQIADTPPAEVQARVARLAKELRDGGESQNIAPHLGFTGREEAIAPLIDLFYREPKSMEPIHALLYLDLDKVRPALAESIKTRGPRYTMMHFVAHVLRVKAEKLIPLLTPWLDDKDGESRYGAVEGLALANRRSAPELFPLLEKRLKDPLAKVRQRASSAIGAYRDAAALQALKTVVRDPDAGVSEQATIAIGWVAKAAPAESDLRQEAVALLREMSNTTGRPAEQAKYWLGQVEEK